MIKLASDHVEKLPGGSAPPRMRLKGGDRGETLPGRLHSLAGQFRRAYYVLTPMLGQWNRQGTCRQADPFLDRCEHIDPVLGEIVVVVNDNRPLIGNHVGLFIGGQRRMFDPGGRYEGREIRLAAYVRYQRWADGPRVHVFRIWVGERDASLLLRRLDRKGWKGVPGFCAKNVYAVIRSISFFSQLHLASGIATPRNLYRALVAYLIRRSAFAAQAIREAEGQYGWRYLRSHIAGRRAETRQPGGYRTATYCAYHPFGTIARRWAH